MACAEFIRNRHSIRRYQSGKIVPSEDIKTILEAAMMAPSACNTRPWKFVVLRNRPLMEKLAAIHPYCKHLLPAGCGIIVVGLPEAQDAIAQGFYPQDCGAAIENLMLQARTMGYGTCWCGLYPRIERCREVAELLDLKEGIPMAIVTLGVPDEDPAPRGYYEEEKVIWKD